MAVDARFSTGQLYNPAISPSPLPSLASVPRLIGMNIHYSMIFLEHLMLYYAQGDFLVRGGSLIRNNDRQTLRSMRRKHPSVITFARTLATTIRKVRKNFFSINTRTRVYAINS